MSDIDRICAAIKQTWDTLGGDRAPSYFKILVRPLSDCVDVHIEIEEGGLLDKRTIVLRKRVRDAETLAPGHTKSHVPDSAHGEAKA